MHLGITEGLGPPRQGGGRMGRSHHFLGGRRGAEGSSSIHFGRGHVSRQELLLELLLERRPKRDGQMSEGEAGQLPLAGLQEPMTSGEAGRLRTQPSSRHLCGGGRPKIAAN